MKTVVLRLAREDVLALDHYFTRKLGYVGHEDSADEAMHALVNQIDKLAQNSRLNLVTELMELPEVEDDSTRLPNP